MFLYVFFTPANFGPFVTGTKNSHTLKGEITTYLKIENTTDKILEAFERQRNIQQVWLLMYNIQSGNVEVTRTWLQETPADTVVSQLAEKLWASLKTY